MSTEISTIITQRQLSTEVKETNSTEQLNSPIDQLYSELGDLVNPLFKPWYCKMFYKIGRENVLLLASKARADGYDKRKYFSRLLKNA